ncbi:45849_t:CDS:2, partial [Gigaspora margarita]
QLVGSTHRQPVSQLIGLIYRLAIGMLSGSSLFSSNTICESDILFQIEDDIQLGKVESSF